MAFPRLEYLNLASVSDREGMPTKAFGRSACASCVVVRIVHWNQRSSTWEDGGLLRTPFSDSFFCLVGVQAGHAMSAEVIAVAQDALLLIAI